MPSPFSSGLTRRALLQRGFWGGLLLGVGGLGFLASRQSRKVPLPPQGLRVLSLREYALVQAIAARMLPERLGTPTVEELEVALLADRALERTDPSAQREIKQLLGVFESAVAGFFLHGHTKPFTALDPSAQDAVLDSWHGSALVLRRTGIEVLRVLVMGCYYASPKAWPAASYPGRPAGYAPHAGLRDRGPRP